MMNWKFAEYEKTLDNVGFKDNDIEKFGQDPAKSIIREAIQNSCDALDTFNNKDCVEILIKVGSISKNLLKNFSQIENHLKSCIDNENDVSENDEVQRHVNAIEENQYRYLEISDFNTTGMTKKAFESFTQGIFKTVKSHQSSQGSKGVGKAAYYACSYLRTMLVSSKGEDGCRFTGVSKIATHKNPFQIGKKLNYKGLYGDSDLIDPNNIPEKLRRTKNGTSIFVIGLWDYDNLDNELITEVLRNYWFAILKNQLVVSVNDKLINSQNINHWILKYFIDFKDYRTGDKQNPRPYYETVEKGKHFKKDIENLGQCSLWLNYSDQYKLGAVARFRKTKMLIYKEIDLDFGFSGVFLCDNEIGNSFLKEIENDAHDSWNPKVNRLHQEKAKKTLFEIKNFIRESYMIYSGGNDKTEFNIDLIDTLFNFEDKGSGNKPQVIETKLRPNGKKIMKDRIIEKVKFIPFYENRELFYKIELTSFIKKNNQTFEIYIGTDSSKDAVNIVKTSLGSYKKNNLTLDIVKGLNIIKKVKLDVPFLVAPSLISKL